jgi:U3 small nucleolar ribonucleoprotein protein IMP4
VPPAEGKPIPSEVRLEEAELRKQVELEDDNTAVQRTHIDNEYAHAGERDPKLLITTSRDPSSRLVQFAKEVKLLFPNSQRVNRGSMVSAHAGAGRGAAIDVALLHAPLAAARCTRPAGPARFSLPPPNPQPPPAPAPRRTGCV